MRWRGAEQYIRCLGTRPGQFREEFSVGPASGLVWSANSSTGGRALAHWPGLGLGRATNFSTGPGSGPGRSGRVDQV